MNTELVQYSDPHCKSQNNVTIQVIPSHEEFSIVLPLRKTLSPRTHSSRLIKPSLSASKYLKILKKMCMPFTPKKVMLIQIFYRHFEYCKMEKCPVILWPRKNVQFYFSSYKSFLLQTLKNMISMKNVLLFIVKTWRK